MDNFIGALRHLFATANVTHIIWCGAVLLTMLMLAVLHHRWKDNTKGLSKWRLLCLVPMLICAVHAGIYVVGAPSFLGGFYAMYIIALLMLIPMLFAKRRTGYRIAAVLTGILSCLCGFYFCASSPLIFNHTRESYTESFHSLVMDMDKHYVLKEWKDVDLAALEEKYMPMVEEAEKEQSQGKFADAVMMFCCELHDGHIGVEADFDDDDYTSVITPHDYGFATVKLDSGEVIAVCTDETANSLGIEDGTVITRWNGKPVLQAAEEDVPNLGTPVKTNEEIVDVMNLDLAGGDTLDVSFLDKNGNEQTVTVSAKEGVDTKREEMAAFRGIEMPIDEEKFLAENFSTKMLDDNCGYLKVVAETMGSTFRNLSGYLTGDQKYAREMFREKLNYLRSQGMEYLVIDLRNNEGGFDEIATALCDLLTDKDWYGQGLGIRKDGKYTCVSDHCIHGTGEFADLKIVALTNYECCSAGDGFSLYLSKLPNVTVAGITDPCGCNQETGGISTLSEGIVTVYYPTGLILNEDGEPNIDVKSDRVSRNPVEVHIPFDRDAAMKIFRDKQDYELEWAVKYVKGDA
ncbi:S41 family peptidase [Ruminococcus albus]|uniref:C-terminal processing protease CtpA/Prc, contains a PDZ domain n=1 Tax=Ruminococcus albus TaxID=1264 RepID=A0A1I1KH32_RUMAL|nr:S41 family peptidase [Ruminococcus albus]SFC59582.1 C-terminal processing protease CtpA/Prc, contains a PDZ domain [Ruminococcus albus]